MQSDQVDEKEVMEAYRQVRTTAPRNEQDEDEALQLAAAYPERILRQAVVMRSAYNRSKR